MLETRITEMLGIKYRIVQNAVPSKLKPRIRVGPGRVLDIAQELHEKGVF
jgi:hypothetical protein